MNSIDENVVIVDFEEDFDDESETGAYAAAIIPNHNEILISG
ncbi:hypothetical protein [Streptomyces sp. NPDC060027]